MPPLKRAALIAILAVAASAQALRFEVASIQRSVPDPAASMTLPMPAKGGEMRRSNVTVKSLIMNAYNVRDFQVSGGPAWIGSARYDIDAKPEPASSLDSPADQMRERTRWLLAQRFHLEIHREAKEMPVYDLGIAKTGLKLRETPEGAPGAGGMRMEIGQIDGRGVPLTVLVGVLSMQTGRVVRDHTGLTGKYDIRLEWMPDPSLGGPLDRRPPGAEPAAPTGVDTPPLLTAIQEQLGLRLEPRRGAVEIIVIDRIEIPTEN